MIFNIVLSIALIAIAGRFMLVKFTGESKLRSEAKICFGVVAVIIPYIVFGV